MNKFLLSIKCAKRRDAIHGMLVGALMGRVIETSFKIIPRQTIFNEYYQNLITQLNENSYDESFNKFYLPNQSNCSDLFYQKYTRCIIASTKNVRLSKSLLDKTPDDLDCDRCENIYLQLLQHSLSNDQISWNQLNNRCKLLVRQQIKNPKIKKFLLNSSCTYQEKHLQSVLSLKFVTEFLFQFEKISDSNDLPISNHFFQILKILNENPQFYHKSDINFLTIGGIFGSVIGFKSMMRDLIFKNNWEILVSESKFCNNEKIASKRSESSFSCLLGSIGAGELLTISNVCDSAF